ncbi:MAG TPA: tRNA (adenosine(37)-N6)-threonylcarbamoyltransferase complex ATPase subunit type 1 TsaE [Candidatus Elarobacter sp.]|nr:tRNA (adenosine(37)-N6)-threonylcarbamoyltransferase complex ATPase subunit type 1 TsaE [Candidatus Elarobacter sp.]
MPAFEARARALAATLRPGDVVALRGSLGAGKTTFARAVVAALHGSDEAVSSPTFVFRQRYEPPHPGVPAVEHIDLYRLENPGELADLALDEAFAPDAVVLIEWPERAEDWLPRRRVEVGIAGAGEGPRTVRVARLP